MPLEHILDRLERMHRHLTCPGDTDENRICRAESMLDALISHVRDAIERERRQPPLPPPPPNHRLTA